MTDIATISLRVNTDEVERGNKALDDFGKTAQETAKKTDDLNRMFKSGPQAVKPASASIAEQRQELQKLLDKISPVNRALNELDTMQEKLRAASKKGLLPADDFEHYNEILEKTRLKVSGVGEETHKLGLKSAGARREIGILIGELARGNIGALRGSGITLANRAGWIDQLLTLKGLGIAGVVGGIATAIYTLGKAYNDGSKESEEFNKQLILTGNYAGVTADQLSTMSKALSGKGATQGDAAAVLAKIVSTGKFAGQTLQTVAKTALAMQRAVGQSVEDTISTFEKLADSPAKASAELNKQLHYLTAAQYEYIASLERSGDMAGAAAAAEKAYADKMAERAQDVQDNLGFIQTAVKAVADEARGMWDQLLGIGRESTLDEKIAKQQELIQNIKANGNSATMFTPYGGMANGVSTGTGALDSAQQMLATLLKQKATSEEKAKAEGEAQAHQQKIIDGEAHFNQLLDTQRSALEKRNAEYKKLDELIAARKADNRPMSESEIAGMRAAIDKKYKDPKVHKTPAVKADAGDRASESAQKELLALQSQLDVLEKHREANDTISAQRKALWQAESQYAVLQKAAGERQLTVQEQQLLASSKETLEYKRQLADLGDKIAKQQQLNKLHQQATKFVEQQTAKQKQLDALAGGATPKEAEREATRDRLKSTYGEGEEGQRVLKEQENTWKKQDELQQNWKAGAESAMKEWAETAQNSYQQVGDYAANTLDGMNDVLGNFLTTGKAGFKDFVTSAISDLAKMLLKMGEVQLMQATLGGTAFGSLFGFAGGGYTGEGGKYEPKGVVHGGEFVFTKEATNRLGVSNLYALMRGGPGYADGGYVGTAPRTGLTGGGIAGGINVSTSVVVQAGGNQSGSDPAAGKALESELKRQMDEAARAVVNKAVKNGGIIWNFVNSKR